MSWISKTLGITVLGALMVAPGLAGQRIGVFVGPVVARPVVVPYGYYGPAYYGYGPYYYPYYRYGYPAYPVGGALGGVKIDSHMKNASVYVDGGYVGPISKFKHFGLRPGNHDIEMRDMNGAVIFHERVQVIVDRTVEIHSPA
jgi:hypothetical protein